MSTAMNVAFVAATAAAVKFSVDAIHAAEAHQRVLGQLSIAIGGNTDALAKQAAATALVTGYTDDQILAAYKSLALFDLSKTSMEAATQAAIDYARFTGGDVTNAATMLGKASLGNARALKTLGIVFTSTGNQANDFATVVGLINNKVGGAGAAYAQTYAGKLAILGAQFDQLKIRVGEALIPALTKLLPVVGNVLSLVARLLPEIVALYGAFLAYRALAFLPVLLGGVATGLAAIAVASESDALLALAAALEAVAGAGIKAAAGTVGAAYLLGSISGVPDDKLAAFNDQLTTMSSIFAAGNIANVGGLAHQVDFLSGAFGANADAVRLAITQNISYADALARLRDPTAVGAGSTADLAQTHADAAAAARAQLNAELSLAGGLSGLLNDLSSAADASDALRAAQNKVNHMQAAGKTGTAAYRQALLDLRNAQQASLSAQLTLASAVQSYLGEVKSGDATQKQAIAQLKVFGQQANLTKGQINGMISDLKAAIAEYNRLAHAPDITKHVTTVYNQVGGHPVIYGATGYHGTVNGPQVFVAGEAGPERVDIGPVSSTPSPAPSAGSGGGVATDVRVNVKLDHRKFGRDQDWMYSSRGYRP